MFCGCALKDLAAVPTIVSSLCTRVQNSLSAAETRVGAACRVGSAEKSEASTIAIPNCPVFRPLPNTSISKSWTPVDGWVAKHAVQTRAAASGGGEWPDTDGIPVRTRARPSSRSETIPDNSEFSQPPPAARNERRGRGRGRGRAAVPHGAAEFLEQHLRRGRRGQARGATRAAGTEAATGRRA
jgi:hypothetical protein